MVNLTRIYTRTGDAGETRLGDMSLTAKTDLRLEAYATTDEAGAAIGVALAHGGIDEDVVKVLTTVQNDLFDVGADLSTPVVADPEYPRSESSRPTSTGSRLGATTTTSRWRSCARSSSPAAPWPRPTCTWPAPSCAARSGRPGLRTRSTARP